MTARSDARRFDMAKRFHKRALKSARHEWHLQFSREPSDEEWTAIQCALFADTPWALLAFIQSQIEEGR